MALPIWQRTITDNQGNVIPGAEVEVVNEATGLAADIFSNRAGTTPRTNPFFTGADGFAQFFVAPGEYRITATGPTGSITWRFNVLTGDAALRNVGTGAFQVPTNGDLGTMSTQNANAVAITGGTVNGVSSQFVVGSAGSPSIAFSGDTNTGLFRPSADNLAAVTNGTERMRITSAGNVLIGATSASTTFGDRQTIQFDSTEGFARFVRSNDPACGIGRRDSNGDAVIFRRDGSTVGSISVTTTATSYNTSSDYRLKEDLQPVEDPIGRLKQLKPFNFAWKVDGTRVDGFLAHEAQEVVPEAVTGTKDAMRTEEYEVSPAVLDEDGNVLEEAVMGEREVPDYQGIDQAKLVPLLTAALQDAVAKIESLEQRIQALEGKEL